MSGNGNSLAVYGGASFGVLLSGGIMSLVFYLAQEGLCESICKKKWILPLIGFFTGIGVATFIAVLILK